MKKENIYAAPPGIYLVPLMSCHNFNNERSMDLPTETFEPVILDSKIGLYSIGDEIGNQFVIKKKMVDWSDIVRPI